MPDVEMDDITAATLELLEVADAKALLTLPVPRLGGLCNVSTTGPDMGAVGVGAGGTPCRNLHLAPLLQPSGDAKNAQGFSESGLPSSLLNRRYFRFSAAFDALSDIVLNL